MKYRMYSGAAAYRRVGHAIRKIGVGIPSRNSGRDAPDLLSSHLFVRTILPPLRPLSPAGALFFAAQWKGGLRYDHALPPRPGHRRALPVILDSKAALSVTRTATLFAALLAFSAVAHANDIACDAPATPAGRIICEHALFSMGYQRIYNDQQRLLQAGVISQADIDGFRARRDKCDTAACLDTVFSAWKQHLVDIGASKALRGKPTK